jgi:N utilization substance protein A
MIFSELGRVIESLGKERGIDRSVVVDAIEQAFLVAARKKFGIQGEYETKYNLDDDEVEIFQYKNVVEEVRDKVVEISHTEARVLDEDCEIGDQLGIKIENPNFSRVDVQTAKQIIFQKVRDAEREILFKEYKHREGDIVTGIARRYERGNIIVDLGKADAILPRREVIPGENFKTGDRIQAYLTEVVMTNRGPEIRLSRTSPLFLLKLFEVEVPEVADGTIEIRAAAREPGHRAKIAVSTSDKDIDPVGACVGMKGSRVQNIVNELQGEKIDIVKWNEDIENYARNALAPSDITSIMLGDDRTMDVIVEEDQLSLAIGRRGQNVRLAAMLTGWKINIISKSKLQERITKAVEVLIQIPGLSETQAQVLVHNGIMAIGDLAATEPATIRGMLDLEMSTAESIIANTHKAIEEGTINLAGEEDDEWVSASAVPNVVHGFIKDNQEGRNRGDRSDSEKFSDVERRLREELAAFKIK